MAQLRSTAARARGGEARRRGAGRRARLRRTLLGMLVALAVVALPRAASAHALLVASDPAGGSIIAAPPARVTLEFSQGVTAAGPGIVVVAPDGRAVSAGSASAAGRRLTVATRPGGEGTYLVQWQVIAEDSHPSRGRLTFSVVRESPVPPGSDYGADLGAQSPLGLFLQSLGRWLHFAGLALGFGVVAFRVLVLPRAEPEPAARLDRLATAGAVLLIAAEPVALAGASIALSLPPGDLIQSAFGRALALRLGGGVLLLASLGAVREEGGRGRGGLLVLGAALTLADGLAGHRIAGQPAVVSYLVGAVHESAMAVWAGGVVAWLAVREGTARFTKVAGAALAVLVVSGLVLAIGHITGPADLWNTDYGAVLAAKAAAVAATALIAATGARRLEAGALAGVLALAGILVSLPAPR